MLLDIFGRIGAVAMVLFGVLAVAYFPWATDQPLTAAEQADLQKFYKKAYDEPAKSNDPEDEDYVRKAEAVAERLGVAQAVSDFVHTYGLSDKKVLDIGAGRGSLQDIVSDFTGLDISLSAQRFFHKPFVLASATAMPFPDNHFDAVWTIFVFEHVPNPEAALSEMRRVVKSGGLLYVAPAWDCAPWVADGYPVRPYSDFGAAGKIEKASIPVQIYLRNLSKIPIRLLRSISWGVLNQPTRFHYRRLVPNYKHYWMEDSDAVNSLDRHEMALWFLSRGDQCLNCEGMLHGWLQENYPLIIRVRK